MPAVTAGAAMGLSFDARKRERTLQERGLDFADAQAVFEAPSFTYQDARRDYGETRWITYGLLDDRLVAVVWTWRSGDRHIISMRKCNDREKARYGSSLE
jgi:uncharacterized DUF497 family protein